MWLFVLGWLRTGDAAIGDRIWECSSVFVYWIWKYIPGKLLFLILCGIFVQEK